MRADIYSATPTQPHCEMEEKWLREVVLREVHPVEGYDEFRLDVYLSCAQERIEKGDGGGVYPLW